MSKTIQLHIPTPCSENWNEMTRNEQGRFCQNCQKTVVDFSQKNDKEILDFFAQKQKNVCGRFAANQTVRPLSDNARREQSTLLQRAASVLLATTLSASSMEAQQQCTVVPTQQTATSPQEKAAMNTEKQAVTSSDSSFLLKGRIVEGNTNEAIIGASVFVRVKEKDRAVKIIVGTNTDLEGNFTLAIPYEYVSATAQLYMSAQAIGFDRQDKILKKELFEHKNGSRVTPLESISLAMSSAQELMGEVAIVKERTFSDKVHDFFLPRREGIVYKDEIKK